jgi:hypothetical protein
VADEELLLELLAATAKDVAGWRLASLSSSLSSSSSSLARAWAKAAAAAVAVATTFAAQTEARWSF